MPDIIKSPLEVLKTVPPSIGVMLAGLLHTSRERGDIVLISVSPVPMFMVKIPSAAKQYIGT